MTASQADGRRSTPSTGATVRRNQPRRRATDERHHGLRRPTGPARRRSARRCAPATSCTGGHRAFPDASCSASVAAKRLGICSTSPARRRSGSTTATGRSSGSSHPVTLDCAIDRAALIGLPGREPAAEPGRPTRPRSTCAPTRTSCRTCATSLRVRGQPRAPRGGRGQPAVRRARGEGRRQGRVHVAAARPRRRRAAGRRRRDRERDGHLACSSAARRSACDARSAPRAGTSRRSS